MVISGRMDIDIWRIFDSFDVCYNVLISIQNICYYNIIRRLTKSQLNEALDGDYVKHLMEISGLLEHNGL